MIYTCLYCDTDHCLFKDIFHHLIEHHSQQEIRFKRRDGIYSKIISFKVIPDICREQGRVITVNHNTENIHISRANTLPKDSPLKKLVRYESRTPKEDEKPMDIEETDETILSESTEVNSQGEDEHFKELSLLLPRVIETLKEAGKLTEYLDFNRLISEKKFPLNNIAFLLFIDVVRWFKLEESSTQMRYSEDVKSFWRTGLRLFHGRFLRLMGGPKHQGQIVEGKTNEGKFLPCVGKVNFIVPDRRVLEEEHLIISDKGPSILHDMIDIVSCYDREQQATYKICVDGKKINPSSKGEENLWGYEQKPTYEEKQSRLGEELTFLREIQKSVETLIDFGHSSYLGVSEKQRYEMIAQCKKLITVLSLRLKDLRILKVKKELCLQRLKEKCEGDWRASQFAMVISSLRTNIYEIENCIGDMLACNDNLCWCASILQQVHGMYKKESVVNLQTQENFVCLSSNQNSDCDPSVLKQRSDGWFNLRKTVLVTGSTINKAIGLDGLKKQKDHLDEKTGRKEPAEASDELKQKFEYGTSNEINAVATFVSKYLPAFHPNYAMYEEGCYIEKNQLDKSVLLVSPDGSVRKKDDENNIISAVEIKCPYPGKTFTTQVQYLLPHYYVPQILSEMYCLRINSLYFLSYTKESMVVHEATFDPELWGTIFSEISSLDGNVIKKKLNPNIPDLRKRIDNYRKERVTIVAEIKATMAIPCDHSKENTGRSRIFHENINRQDMEQEGKHLLKLLHKTFLRGSELIQDCHRLCVQKASEVLVFLISDLDRSYKAEISHAFPIAYALKGYSMKAEAMRKMLQDVLHCLFVKGLYTPVIAYDGQWARLAFHSSDGKPLTILELQRKVYNDVKSKRVAELTKEIFNTAVVKAVTFQDLLEQVDYRRNADNGIVVGPKDTRLFRTSSHTALLINTTTTKSRKKDTSNFVSDEQTGIDHVLSTIPAEVLSHIDDEVITSVNAINGQADTRTIIDEVDEGIVESLDFEGVASVSFESGNLVVATTTHIEHEIRSEIPIAEEERPEIEDSECDEERSIPSTLSKEDAQRMLSALKSDAKFSKKWNTEEVDEFYALLKTKTLTCTRMTKLEVTCCLQVANAEGVKITFSKSWKKERLVDLLNRAFTSVIIDPTPKQRKRRKNPISLASHCKKIVKAFPKVVLNAIVSENSFPDHVDNWRLDIPFSPTTTITGVGKIKWFSTPEYNIDTLSYVFSFLDMHHLITNCRIKVCKDGFLERGISKQAWYDVAKENKTNLKISHVEDLVDKQSDSIAKQTFSDDVESSMRAMGYVQEPHFCRLIREFYEAEDDPGLSTKERCLRRLRLRTWLLDEVNFCGFPPYGTHIRGIPNIMFQGFLTNIDRRLQLFPFVKSGKYNVRSLGSLENENFFGEFQDLDPKGPGIIKAEDVPSALETACQLLRTRLTPERPFHMALSRAKVYPVHNLLEHADSEMGDCGLFLYPSLTDHIILRDHMFDNKCRAKRKARRKLVGISMPDDPSRGMAPVRQYHKCDESKILPHKRLGIDLE